MKRNVHIENSESRLGIKEKDIVKIIRYIDSEGTFRIPSGDLNVSFITKAASSDLHLRFFDDPDPTDVMTFPGDEEDDHAGDIAICPEIAFSAAALYHATFAHEMTLYLIHSCLHLAGLKDSTEADIRIMREAESLLMGKLDKALWESAFWWK